MHYYANVGCGSAAHTRARNRSNNWRAWTPKTYSYPELVRKRGDDTPWKYVKDKEWDAQRHIVSELESALPHWADTGDISTGLDICICRGVETWNVKEKLVFDKSGEEAEREWVSCEFRVGFIWKGRRLRDVYVDLTYDEDDREFSSLSTGEIKEILNKIQKEFEVPDDAGFHEHTEI